MSVAVLSCVLNANIFIQKRSLSKQNIIPEAVPLKVHVLSRNFSKYQYG